MNDELIAAVAFALKRWRSVDMSYMPVYPGGQKRFDEDCQVLAQAYLGEHPADDDEPITEEWLRENGWVRNQLRMVMDVAGREIELYECSISDSPLNGLLWNAYWRVPCEESRQQWPIPMTKRQQLRRLMSALGIEGKQ